MVRKPLYLCVITSILLVLVGFGMNRFVVEANGGRMPVDTGLLVRDAAHFTGKAIGSRWAVLTAHTAYPYLGDVIQLPGMWWVSVGDISMVSGLLTLIGYIFIGGVKQMKKVLRCQKGFTLIELLVVIVIIGILAAVAIPNVTGLISRGKTAAAQTESMSVKAAVVAVMTGAGVATVTGAPKTINKTTDFVIGSEKVSDYVGLAELKGTYSVAANGSVTQTSTGY